VKRRRVLIIVAIALAVAIVAAVAWPRQREPEYQGKKLSEWLYLDTVVTEPGSEAAADAVRQIGTNGLPWMLRHVSVEPGKWRQVVAKFPKPFDQAATWKDGRWERACALRAFQILGPLARPAVPQLTDWANNAPTGSQRRAFAVAALGDMGPDFLNIPSRVRELNWPDAGVRERATNELMRIAPEMLTNRAVR
jgi:hypothetical protein